MDSPQMPDLLSLIPEGNPKRIIRFGLEELKLSSDELEDVLHDARKISSAINLLLEGGILTGPDCRAANSERLAT